MSCEGANDGELGDVGGSSDGGSADDPFGSGQSTSTLLAKILRIDVNSRSAMGRGRDRHELQYGIPSDNPFVKEPDMGDRGVSVAKGKTARVDFTLSRGDREELRAAHDTFGALVTSIHGMVAVQRHIGVLDDAARAGDVVYPEHIGKAEFLARLADLIAK